MSVETMKNDLVAFKSPCIFYATPLNANRACNFEDKSYRTNTVPKGSLRAEVISRLALFYAMAK